LMIPVFVVASLFLLGALVALLPALGRILKGASSYVVQGVMLLVALAWAALFLDGLPLIRGTGWVRVDALSAVVSMTAASVGFLVASSSRRLRNAWQFQLVLSSGVLGTVILASSADPLILLVSWGLVSVSGYSLLALAGDRSSLVGSIKYALMSALSFQLLMVALYLMFAGSGNPRLVALGTMLFLVALGFKAGIPPFHMWLPDVYGFAEPVSVSGLSAIMKLGALALAIRLTEQVVLAVGGPEGHVVVLVLVLLSAGSMLIGNLGALTQDDVQRMMAYSSIAQVGYVLMGISAFDAALVYGQPHVAYEALLGTFFFIPSYALSKAGIFSMLAGFKGGAGTGVQALAGSKAPESVSASVVLLNLLGMPPLLGFWAKLLVFEAAASSAIPVFYALGFPWYALYGIANSAISAFYYLKVLRAVYSSGKLEADHFHLRVAELGSAALLVLAGLIVPLLVL